MDTRKNTAKKRKSQSGMTLLELLVVLVILALVAGIAAPRVIGYLSKAKSDTALLQMRQLVSALNLYRLDIGRYPSEQEGLQALVTQPTGAEKWRGPYIDRPEGIKDPWGAVYGYKLPGAHGEVDLVSYGADGQPGGDGEDKDIGSWE
jgi:general secretion pathway protein G